MKSTGLRFFVSLLMGTALGCSSGTEIKTHSIPGGSEERIAAVEGIIKKSAPIPSAIRQAEFLEEQQGDGMLGPSFFRSFIRIEVDSADVGKWKKALLPSRETKDFVSPQSPVEWWVGEDDFRKLELYEPKSLFGRSFGWVGFSPDQKTIYVTTHTN